MSKIPDAQTLRDLISTVNEDANKPLSAWEESFMESITDQFERSGCLSVKQIEILERIYSEKTP